VKPLFCIVIILFFDSIKGFVSFNFMSDISSLTFIGSTHQQISVCEDLPVNSKIMELTVFDSSLSARPVCFRLNSEYFKLMPENFRPSGTVLLAKTLEHKQSNATALHRFKAHAYFCDRSDQKITQDVSVRVLQVNQYAPEIKLPVSVSVGSMLKTLKILKILFMKGPNTIGLQKSIDQSAYS
jgi:hypothetical protein